MAVVYLNFEIPQRAENHTMVNAFYAYPTKPSSVGESILAAIDTINNAGEVNISPWSKLSVNGKLVVNEICRAIDQADLFCADLTGINSNVMFELGYAIAKNKRVWLTLQSGYSQSRAQCDSLRMLTTVGYASYENSRDIVNKFYTDSPHTGLTDTIYDRSIRPNTCASQGTSVLYLKSKYQNEAAVRIDSRCDESQVEFVVDDPRESPIRSLTWYGVQVHASVGVLCHLMSPQRDDALVYNARSALVAGMAHGLERRVLMLVEGDHLLPMDYRDIAYQYSSAAVAHQTVDIWLRKAEAEHKTREADRLDYERSAAKVSELRQLTIGDYIAENESSRLTSGYFVETAAYQEALNGQHVVFVGAKGSGKSANLLQLQTVLQADKRNIVCVIKPPDYEIQGVVRLLAALSEQDVKGFAIASLWKFLLYTEIADSVARQLEARASRSFDEDEDSFLWFLNTTHPDLRQPFTIRLERKVAELHDAAEASPPNETTTSASRLTISETLHKGIIKEVRKLLKPLLEGRQRIALLIDNLDLAWDRHADVPALAAVVLGLLSAAQAMSAELRHEGGVEVTLAVFLRADMFHRIQKYAQEPDKIRVCRIRWDDPQMLLRLIDERLEESQGRSATASVVWKRYFTEQVRGMGVREYMVSRTLPRPRDLLFFVQTAIATATNRRRATVDQSDIIEAEKLYSKFAYDVLLIETGESAQQIDDVLTGFLGSKPLLTGVELMSVITCSSPGSSVERIISELCARSFLGIEVKDGDFRYAADPEDLKRIQGWAQKYASGNADTIRYRIHPAFWTYLDVDELPSMCGAIAGET